MIDGQVLQVAMAHINAVAGDGESYAPEGLKGLNLDIDRQALKLLHDTVCHGKQLEGECRGGLAVQSFLLGLAAARVEADAR